MKRQRIKIEGPSTVTSFEAPDELLERMRKKCDERNIFRNAAVIEALRQWVDQEKGTGTSITKENVKPDTSVKYNLHVVRQKSQKVVEIMGEIVSELDLATGENIVVPNTDLEERTSAATVEAENAVGELTQDTTELQESIEKPRKPKRSDNRSVSGGAA